MGPDWSNLHAELIQLISEKVVFKEQYTHLRLVCRHWRRACPPHPPRHLIDKAPWLWLPHEGFSSTLSFYNISPSKIYDFDLPNVVRGPIIACSRGWILIENDSKLSLYNPVTREMKSNCLPSLAPPPIILPFARNEKTTEHLHFDIHHGFTPYIRKVILTSSPSYEGCIVVAQFRKVWDLGFCRVGDNSWTILKLVEYGLRSCYTLDFNYKNGLVYTMNNKGQLTVYDLRYRSMKASVPNLMVDNISHLHGFRQLYLVIGEGELDGEPLVVIRLEDNMMTKFEVYKCGVIQDECRWRRVRNIGNSVLVLDRRQCEMLLLDNFQLNRWEKNHVYYGTWTSSKSRYSNCSTRIASIDNGSIKALNSLSVFRSYNGRTPNEYVSWFTPSL
ncbi:hypothetical protein LUZ60_005792 [Juncus effusus]|nr:hypothetical protein LUZ60_005792 [Juncus effusus]